MRRMKLYLAVVAEIDGKYYPYTVPWDFCNPVDLCFFVTEHNIRKSWIFKTKIEAAVKVEELRKEFEEKNLLAFVYPF